MSKWALKVDIHTIQRGIFTEWTNLVTAFENAAYGLSQNRLAVATGITKAVSKRYWNRKGQSHRRIYNQSLWEALERFNPDAPLEKCCLIMKFAFRQQTYSRWSKHLTTETVYFLHEDYGFYSYSEHYALGDIFDPLTMNWTRSSGGVESWVQTIWKLSSGTTKKLVWVLYGRFGGWRCDETPWPCH